MASSQIRSLRLPLSILALLLVVPSLSSAVTFNLVYRGPTSASPDARATAPSYDPTGALLTMQMQQAAADWSALVGDPHTITINYFYATVEDVPGRTANAATIASSPSNPGSNIPNRTDVGEIKFYEGLVGGIAERFFDPTPSSDNEFDLDQVLLGDLSTAEQADGFNLGPGGAPLLEIGYRGSAPAGSPAVDKSDVLSTARHEIGHLMGVTNSGQLLGAGVETADGDYDLDPALIGGATVGAKFFAAGTPGNTDSHLQAMEPIMSGLGSPLGTRRDITATDVFAAAAVGDWTDINLPRVDFVRSNTNFNTAANWSGNRLPDVTDFVAIRHGDNVTMTASDAVGSLLVTQGSTLTTGANTLSSQGDMTVGPTAQITASAGGLLGADDFHVEAGGVLALAGGVASAAQGDVINDGTVSGRGTIRFDLDFVNRGLLEASGGTLVLEEAINDSGAEIDLDGPPGSNGEVRAVTGSLDVNVGLAGAVDGSPHFFSSDMTIGPGRFVEVDDNLRIQNGTLTLDGSAALTAEFRGAELEVAGDILADRQAAIDAVVELTGLANVSVPQANDTLTFLDTVELAGGDILGAGKIVFDGGFNDFFGDIVVGEIEFNTDAIVAGSDINAGIIDADGARFGQTGGSLDFEKLIGKLEQSGGVIEASRSLIEGTLDQTSQAEIAVDIAGVGDNGRLDITGDAVVNGVISVTLTNGFDPSGGEQFQVLTADALDVNSLSLGGPDGDRFELLVGGDDIVLRALAPVTLAADFNGDGVVDLLDLDILGTNFGQPSTMATGDANGDGVTDLLDLDILGATFGDTAAVSVPEPGAFGLIAAAALLAGPRRRTSAG